jgi:concentrative nucleoside transporter, CNT family
VPMSPSKENLPLEGHNASPQPGVDTNPDPALDFGNEHRHEHSHHHGLAATEKAKEDDVMYTTGTTEKGYDLLDAPPQDYTTHKLHESPVNEKPVDEESGNVGPATDEAKSASSTRFHRYYRKFRPFIPILIWCVFTA